MPQQKMCGLNVNLPSAADLQVVKAVLRYEAAVRKVSIGQACYELVVEAADVGSYPAEVRCRIDEIEARGRERAVARAIAAMRGDRLAKGA